MKKKSSSTTTQDSQSQQQQHSTASSNDNQLKQVQKLNYFGPDYNAVWNEPRQAYDMLLTQPLAEQRDIRMKQAPKVLEALGGYQPTSLTSQNTKDITGALNQVTDLDMMDAYNKLNNRTTAERDRGSSFDAARQANLELGWQKQRAANVLQGLQGATSLDTQNLSNESSLLNLLNTNPTPTFQPGNYLEPYANKTGTGSSSSVSDTTGSSSSSATSKTNNKNSGGIGGLISDAASIAGAFSKL